MYINGTWVNGISNEYFEVVNPSNGEIIDYVPMGNGQDATKAIDAAHAAFKEWGKESAYKRCDLLEKLYDLMIEEKEIIAEIMTEEQGKPLKEAIGEVVYAANFIKWYSEEGKRVYGQTIPSTATDKRILVHKQPVGVVAAITPWNFPAAMITRKLAPALAAGCTIVVKPPKQTPLTALKLFELIHRAGFPKGVANIVTGDARAIGEALMRDTRVRKITFTGSTEVGKKLMAQAAGTVKNISLELGGHAPLLVFEDADIEKAVEGTLASKFRNCGQVCIATNRVLADEKVLDQYVDALKDAVSDLKFGDGFLEDVSLGPIIDKAGFLKIKEHVEDAVSKGAEVVCGGVGHHMSESEDAGYFFEPTILKNVTRDMMIMNEETFGPIVPVMEFKSDEEAIEISNDTNYGLAAYVFTESISRGFKVSEALEFGIVGLNTGAPSSAQAPFGGFKESGLGREGGHFGLEEFLEVKYIALGL